MLLTICALKYNIPYRQVSSINRVLRNLTTESPKEGHSPMYDKFGLFTGGAWHRSNPWYSASNNNNNNTQSIAMPQHGLQAPTMSAAPTYSSHHGVHPMGTKKGKYILFNYIIGFIQWALRRINIF